MKSILKSLSFFALASSLAWAAEPLLLQWGTIDTSSAAAQAESAALKAALAKKAAAARKAGAAAESRAAYVVQFPGPVADEWRAWLESATQVRGYLPEFAYLVWATASEMETIAANPDVFWTGEWKKEYKTVCAGTVPAAKGTASVSADEARWMQVGSLLTGDDGAADLRARLEALPADVRSAFPRLDGSSAVAFLTDAQIDEVAVWPDVEWIEPKLKARLFNDQAARTNMMNVSNAWKSLSSGGLGLTGAGQIVAVADTGCDKGSKTDIHADFAGRVLAGYGWTNGAYKASASWADLDAHGTHVCGSVLGDGSKSGGQYRGMAYEAQLVMQGMWEDLGGLPDYTGDMLKQAYSAGARIHSDSWGYGTNYAGAYVYDSVYSDGYMWTNQNFIMVIAASNDGIDANSDGVIDAGSVTAPGTAKNCICVGAAENYRTSGGYAASTYGTRWPSDYPANPIKNDKISQTNTPQGIVAFSARGPTLDGRFKPDIVAPGSDIISVRSRASDDTGWGLNSANTNYIYMGGTSMATPLTSGTMALIRQWLVDRQGIDEPMAALMKALLINGARDMTPGQYGTGAYQEVTARPDRSQGFGHVNLYNSLEPGDGNFLVFATNTLTTSANFTTNIAVGQASAGKYLLTLVWQDYPGSSGGSKNLVNDLDLTVTSPSGTVYYPNNLSGLDHVNNVEFIEFTATETGTYAVKVNGYSVSKTSPNGGQPFALVMRGPETFTDPVPPAFSSATSATSGVQFEDIEFTFSSLLTAGYPTPTYHLTTAVSSDEYGFEQSNGYLLFTPQSYGTFTFKCVASNENGTATNTLTVTVTQAPPAVPVNLALSDIGTSSFTASWSAASNADSYSLDVATVSGSGGPSTLISETFSSSMGWTSSGNSYTSGTHANANGTWTYDNAIFHPSDEASSPGSAGNIQLQKAAYLYFPPVDNPSSVSINAKGSSTGTMVLEQQIDGSWTTIASESISGTVAHYEVSVSGAGAATAFRVHSGDRALYLYDVTVSGASASYTSLSGYPKNVSSVSASVTGLSPATDYAARVRGVNDAGASDWSDWATATTLAGISAPSWAALPSPVVNVGSNYSITLSDYVSGSPAPTISLTATTADSGDYEYEDGILMFTPPSTDAYTFDFTADNGISPSANATLTITGHAEAPVLASIADVSATLGTNGVELTVSATAGIPAPVFSVTSPDASDYGIDENSGHFLFYPSAIGTYHFTVTATNIAGSDSETFTVTVSAPPITVPVLTVANITDTTAIATWTPCEGVSTYTLQLASDDQFTTGGSGDTVTLFSNTEISTTAPDGWTYNIGGATGTGGLFLYSGNSIVSEEFDASACIDLSLSLNLRTYGGTEGTSATMLVEYSTDQGSNWSTLGSITATGNKLTASYSLDVSDAAGNASVRLRFTDPGATSSKGVGVANFVLTGTESGGGGSLISTDTVNGLSHAFTGLDPVTTYYARVKGDSDWSSVVSFTTQSAGTSAPVVTVPQDSYSVLVGAPAISFAVTATGTPEPTVTATCTEGVDFGFENNTFVFDPSAIGTYHFVFTATNSEGSDSKTVTVTVAGAAPSISVPQTSYDVAVGDVVNFTVNATGAPEPTVTATCTEGADFVFENKAFQFTPAAVGTYHFVFTATNSEGSDSETVTIVVSPPPVTVPELTVTNVTDTTALATWSACDGVSAYTLQLSTNDFAAAASSAAARGVTNLLTETFANALGFSTAAISDFDNIMDNDGWEGSYVYVHDGSVRISSSKNTGDIESPWLTNATAGATVTLAFGSVSWTNASTTVNVTVTEDGSTYSDPISFALTESMTTYTTNFPVYGTRFRVRWAPSAANKRFFLDDVVITSASSGGDDIEEFTVAGTSHTFTNLTPETTYYARVKGEADWSNVAPFTTTLASGPIVSLSATATEVEVGDEVTITATATGFSGDVTWEWLADEGSGNGDTFTLIPSAAGEYVVMAEATCGSESADASVTITVSEPVVLPTYTQVETKEDFVLGAKYLVVAHASSSYSALKNANPSGNDNRIDVEQVTRGGKSIATGSDAIVWQIDAGAAKSQYVLFNEAEGVYAAAPSSDSNAAQLLSDGTSDYAQWTLTFTEGSELVSIASVEQYSNESRLLQRNNSSAFFATYKGTQISPSLYRLDSQPVQRVTFDVNGEGATCPKAAGTYLREGTYSEFEMPVWANHKFFGWFTEREGGTRVMQGSEVTGGSTLTLYAHWEPSQTVYLDVNGGPLAKDPIVCVRGGYYTGLTKPTWDDNHVFKGWYSEPAGGTRVSASTPVTDDLERTLYAHWKILRQTVTLDTNGDGATCSWRTVMGIPGKTYAGFVKPVWAGHDFLGWFDDPVAGTRVKAGDVVTDAAERTLYAHWKSWQTVYFNPNGDGATCSKPSVACVIGGTYAGFTKPVWGANTFRGWYDDPTGGKRVRGGDEVTDAPERTLYAHWRANAAPLGISGFSMSPRSSSLARDARADTVEVTLWLEMIADVTYEVQWTPSLDGEWTARKRWTADDDGVRGIPVSIPAGYSTGFFRLVQVDVD